jgi:hypothetical protein
LLDVTHVLSVCDIVPAPTELVKVRNVVFGKAIQATEFDR